MHRREHAVVLRDVRHVGRVQAGVVAAGAATTLQAAWRGHLARPGAQASGRCNWKVDALAKISGVFLAQVLFSARTKPIPTSTWTKIEQSFVKDMNQFAEMGGTALQWSSAIIAYVGPALAKLPPTIKCLMGTFEGQLPGLLGVAQEFLDSGRIEVRAVRAVLDQMPCRTRGLLALEVAILMRQHVTEGMSPAQAPGTSEFAAQRLRRFAELGGTQMEYANFLLALKMPGRPKLWREWVHTHTELLRLALSDRVGGPLGLLTANIASPEYKAAANDVRTKASMAAENAEGWPQSYHLPEYRERMCRGVAQWQAVADTCAAVQASFEGFGLYVSEAAHVCRLHQESGRMQTEAAILAQATTNRRLSESRRRAAWDLWSEYSSDPPIAGAIAVYCHSELCSIRAQLAAWEAKQNAMSAWKQDDAYHAQAKEARHHINYLIHARVVVAETLESYLTGRGGAGHWTADGFLKRRSGSPPNGQAPLQEGQQEADEPSRAERRHAARLAQKGRRVVRECVSGAIGAIVRRAHEADAARLAADRRRALFRRVAAALPAAAAAQRDFIKETPLN